MIYNVRFYYTAQWISYLCIYIYIYVSTLFWILFPWLWLCAQSCLTLVTPWIVAHEVPLIMEFSRQEYCCGLPFPTLGDLCNSGIIPASLVFPALAGGFFSTSTTWKPKKVIMWVIIKYWVEFPVLYNRSLLVVYFTCSSMWMLFPFIQGFPGGSEVKGSACNVGDWGSIPGSGRSPGEGNGNPLQYSCLGNPMDRGAWLVTVHGVAQSQTWMSDFISFLFQCVDFIPKLVICPSPPHFPFSSHKFLFEICESIL